MKLTRRHALLGSLSISATAALPRISHALNGRPWPSPLVVVITARNSAIAMRRITRAYAPFLAAGVPVSISLPGPAPDDQDRLAELRRAIEQHPGLLEAAVDLGTTTAPDAYSQTRHASDAQAAFTHAINPRKQPAEEPLLTALTATTTTPLRSGTDMLGFRAAGIRTVIHLHSPDQPDNSIQPEIGGFWLRENGLADVFATAPLSLSRAVSPSAVRKAIDEAAQRDAPIVVHLDLDGMFDLTETELSSFASSVAVVIAAARDASHIRCLLPTTLYEQNRKEDARFVIVRVDDYRVDHTHRALHERFVRGLLEAGIPLTEAVIPLGAGTLLSHDEPARRHLRQLRRETGYELAQHGWKHSTNEFDVQGFAEDLRTLRAGAREIDQAAGSIPRTFIPPNNVMDETALRALAEAGFSTFSSQRNDYRFFNGLDWHGLLHVSNTIAPEISWQAPYPYLETDELLTRFGSRNDAVFMIHPNTMTEPRKVDIVLDTLAALAAQPGTTLANFSQYREAVLQPMPMLDRIQKARSVVVVRDSHTAGDETTPRVDVARLQQDAETAWEYFVWGAARHSGMAPATGWREGQRLASYPFVTMWDIGTHIQAAMAAHRIGLIDQQKFEQSVSTITKFLGASFFRYKGARLPENERALAREQPGRIGFDSADTGRLLIALKTLDLYTNSAFDIGKLVARWNLDVSIIDGELHDIKGGRHRSIHQNSYTGYTRQGYLAWGFDVKPAVNDVDVGETMDATMRFAEEMRALGRIATEPHTTEEIELGANGRTRTINNLMLAAQIERFEKTGILTCASEGPIDEEPFFSYQGYQMDANGSGSFVVDASNPSRIASTAARGDAMRLVSTKGCFLWAAVRPGAYSDRLLDAAREKAVIPGVGFSSGIYEATGLAAPLSDINTNGIILETIAYMLNGRKPFLNLRDTGDTVL